MNYQLEHSDEKVEYVHDKALCAGNPCTIHNRTDHHMRAWPQHWRQDDIDVRGMMERICPHGNGHPDPDEAFPQPHECPCDCCVGVPYETHQPIWIRVPPEDYWPDADQARDGVDDLMLSESELNALSDNADKNVWVYEKMAIHAQQSNAADDQARYTWLAAINRHRARQLRELAAWLSQKLDREDEKMQSEEDASA